MSISILQAIERMALMAAKVDIAKREALERAADLVEEEAKALLGTYDAGWKQLADVTQAAREKAGFPANEPLLVEGKLRDSIGHAVEGSRAVVGSNSEIAVYQELGTDHIPPRSFLASAAHRKAEEVARILGEGAIEGIVGHKV